MATKAQIEANRRNAHKSTGPRTSQGKSRSSANALRHGLTARILILASEEAAGYEEVRADFAQTYQPVGAGECALVDRLAGAWWRTLRSRHVERNLSTIEIDTWKSKYEKDPKPKHNTDMGGLAVSMLTRGADWHTYLRYDAQIQKEFFQTLNTLERVQSARLKREHEQERYEREREKYERERAQYEERQLPKTLTAGQQASQTPNWLPFVVRETSSVSGKKTPVAPRESPIPEPVLAAEIPAPQDPT